MIKEKDLHVGNYIMSIQTSEIYKIVEVSRQWGWFSVKLPNGKVREFRMNNENSSFVNLTKEQVADFYLNLANANLSDSWREYDEG